MTETEETAAPAAAGETTETEQAEATAEAETAAAHQAAETEETEETEEAEETEETPAETEPFASEPDTFELVARRARAPFQTAPDLAVADLAEDDQRNPPMLDRLASRAQTFGGDDESGPEDLRRRLAGRLDPPTDAAGSIRERLAQAGISASYGRRVRVRRRSRPRRLPRRRAGVDGRSRVLTRSGPLPVARHDRRRRRNLGLVLDASHRRQRVGRWKYHPGRRRAARSGSTQRGRSARRGTGDRAAVVRRRRDLDAPRGHRVRGSGSLFRAVRVGGVDQCADVVFDANAARSA